MQLFVLEAIYHFHKKLLFVTSGIANGESIGRDSLFGGLGNDLLNGGVNNDNLTGGAGKDTFVFNTAFTANIDRITDFRPVEDTIKLENAIFTRLTVTGILSVNEFYIGSSAADSSDHIIYNKSTGAILYDDDGNGAHAAVQIAVIGTNLSITNADFVIT